MDIDDVYAIYCYRNKNNSMQFIEYLQDNQSLGLSCSVWQSIHNLFEEYLLNVCSNIDFYRWLKQNY